jgi:transcriptional regulator, propionate catabolism operon regulatory protein
MGTVSIEACNILNEKTLRPHRMLIVCASPAYVNRYARAVWSPQGKTNPEDVMAAQEQDVPAVREIDLSHAVRSDACVLFTGDEETAELLARRVHGLSGWRQGPFLPVDCNEPADRLEPHLFELLDIENPRAFNNPWPTLSQCGTIFLRDVGRLPWSIQRRLSDRLAVLRTSPGEPRRIRRRVISSTPIPLVDRVDEGTFDGSLYYRLNVIHLVISQG